MAVFPFFFPAIPRRSSQYHASISCSFLSFLQYCNHRCSIMDAFFGPSHSLQSHFITKFFFIAAWFRLILFSFCFSVIPLCCSVLLFKPTHLCASSLCSGFVFFFLLLLLLTIHETLPVWLAQDHLPTGIPCPTIAEHAPSLFWLTDHILQVTKAVRYGQSVVPLSGPCCSHDCVSWFSTAQLMQLRQHYWGLASERDRLQWLITYISAQSLQACEPWARLPFSVLGKYVCQKAFRSIYCFSHGKLQKAKHHVLSCQLQAPDHGNAGKVHVSEGVLYAHACSRAT